jgi:hypothetical protein
MDQVVLDIEEHTRRLRRVNPREKARASRLARVSWPLSTLR